MITNNDETKPIILVPRQQYRVGGFLIENLTMQDTETCVHKTPEGILIEAREPCKILVSYFP